VRGGKSAHGDGEGAVDGVGPGLGADGVAVFNGRWETGAYDGPACLWVLCAPVERVGINTVLVGVSCRSSLGMDGCY
jgi:hypothetical protein